MTSLRLRLFSMIVATTVLVWSAASAWVYLHTQAEIQRVLDRRLIEAATMVSSLAQDSGALAGGREPTLVPLPRYSRQLSCQIWSMSGQLVARSSGAPSEPLAVGGTGMTKRVIDGEKWRVYTVVDAARGVRVSVGDSLGVRQRLIRDLMLGLLLPALAGLVSLSILIWAAVGKGLRPLREIAIALRERAASDFNALAVPRTSTELSPLIEAIDERSRLLRQVRDAERHFIASAAHELQTPLAGLKTHAQIASRTSDHAVLEQSLASISQSVDRTARLVRQLLDLARAEGRQAGNPSRLDLGKVAAVLAAEFSPDSHSGENRLTIDERLVGTEVHADETELLLALRNLVSNSLNHSPRGAQVRLKLSSQGEQIGLSVEDDGPGIAEEELESVRQRFMRGSQARGTGSGLGLSIVELVASRIGGRLELRNLEPAGFSATLWLPPASADHARGGLVRG